jgi:DNA-binding PucR family transcriptional regulator
VQVSVSPNFQEPSRLTSQLTVNWVAESLRKMKRSAGVALPAGGSLLQTLRYEDYNWDLATNAVASDHGMGVWCMAKTVVTSSFSRATATTTSRISSGS